MIQSTLLEFLEDHGIYLQDQRVYLMRHKDKRYPDLKDTIGTHQMTLYQASQKLRHEPGSLFVSFYGHEAKRARFIGAWKVLRVTDMKTALEAGNTEGSFEVLSESPENYFHELQPVSSLDVFRHRLDIHWGKEIAWRRVLKKTNEYPIWIYDNPQS